MTRADFSYSLITKMLRYALILTADREYAQTMRHSLLGLGDDRSRVDVELDALRAMQLVPQLYELILIDVSLGAMDGLQLLLLMKHQAPAAKFVIVSDATDDLLRSKAYQNGADFFLVRPHAADAFAIALEAISGLLRDRRGDSRPIPSPQSPGADIPPVLPVASSGQLRIVSSERPADTASLSVILEAPPRLDDPPASAPEPVREPHPTMTGETRLPQLNSHWKINLTGELLEGSQVADPDRCAFITYFIFRKLADVAVALEVDYFNSMILLGPHLQQVLVADNMGIRHGVFDTAWTTEEMRVQYVKWCCEQSF